MENSSLLSLMPFCAPEYEVNGTSIVHCNPDHTCLHVFILFFLHLCGCIGVHMQIDVVHWTVVFVIFLQLFATIEWFISNASFKLLHHWKIQIWEH